jgi:hypothetical protein
MSGYRSGARRGLERTLPGWPLVTRKSYDLPDFRALGDGPYPPILLEAVEGAGDRFERWNEQVEHTGYCPPDPAVGKGRAHGPGHGEVGGRLHD